MEKTLTAICDYLNNYFKVEIKPVEVTISNGSFDSDFLQEGQYFRLVGSVFPENNGVFKYPVIGLHDEDFKGFIWSMAVPQTVIDLALEIEAWQSKYGSANSAAMSPFTSESMGIYSYSKDSSSSGGSGNANSWQSVYAARLAPYRRLRGLR